MSTKKTAAAKAASAPLKGSASKKIPPAVSAAVKKPPAKKVVAEVKARIDVGNVKDAKIKVAGKEIPIKESTAKTLLKATEEAIIKEVQSSTVAKADAINAIKRAQRPPVKKVGAAPATPSASRREVKSMKKAVRASLKQPTESTKESASKLREANSEFKKLYNPPK